SVGVSSFSRVEVSPAFFLSWFDDPPYLARHLNQPLECAMKNKLTRRSFVKHSALAAGVFATAPFNILSAANAGEKVRFVQIGCGGRGMAHLAGAEKEHLVGLVEVDDNRPAAVKKWMQGKGGNTDKIQVF